MLDGLFVLILLDICPSGDEVGSLAGGMLFQSLLRQLDKLWLWHPRSAVVEQLVPIFHRGGLQINSKTHALGGKAVLSHRIAPISLQFVDLVRRRMHLDDCSEEGIHIVEQRYRIEAGSDVAFLDLVTIVGKFPERALQVLFHDLHLCIDIEIAVDECRSDKSVGSILIAGHAVIICLSDPHIGVVGFHSGSSLISLLGLRNLSVLHLQITQLHTIAHVVGIACDEFAVFVEALFGTFLVAENGELVTCKLLVDAL